MMVCGSPPSQSSTPSMVVAPTPTPDNDPDPELHTFREAIALSGKNYFVLVDIYVVALGRMFTARRISDSYAVFERINKG